MLRRIKKIFKRLLLILLGLILTLVLVATLVVNFHPAFGAIPSADALEKIKLVDNYQDGRFTNIHDIKEEFTWDDYKKMFSKFMEENPRRVPEGEFPLIKWTKEALAEIPDSSATAIWYGHSAFYLKMNGMDILLDPMFGDYPAPLPYLTEKRFNDELPIEIDDLPSIELVILSHDHYDHLDYGSILKLKDKTEKFIVPLGLGSHLEEWGVEKEKITELNWHESVSFGNVKLVCTPAQHFSGRGITDRNTTLWASWVIEGRQKIFFSGDSGYFEDFKTIGDQYGPFDACLMECGQYNVLWHDIHMMPEETAQAHLDLKGEMLIPIHWGAFALAMHDWDDPVKRLSVASEKLGINMVTPKIGEKIVIGSDQVYEDWWKLIDEYAAVQPN